MTTVGAGNGNDNRDKKGSPNIYGIVGGVSTGIILLLLLAAIHKWYKSRKQQPWLLPQSLAEEGMYFLSSILCTIYLELGWELNNYLGKLYCVSIL